MGKTKRKWIETDWASSGCLRAQDVPYDENTSIKTKIDEVNTTKSNVKFHSELITSFTQDGDYYYCDSTHNFDTTAAILVNVYNVASDQSIINFNAEILSSNVTRLWFSKTYAQGIKVLLSDGLGSTARTGTLTSFTLDGEYYYSDFTHGLDTTNVLFVEAYDGVEEKTILSYNAEPYTSNVTRFWFSQSYSSVKVIVSDLSADSVGMLNVQDADSNIIAENIDVLSVDTNSGLSATNVENGKILLKSSNIILPFDNSDLTAGVYSADHGADPKYVICQVYNNIDKQIVPDDVTLIDSTSLDVDVTSFVPISGTWRIIIRP